MRNSGRALQDVSLIGEVRPLHNKMELQTCSDMFFQQCENGLWEIVAHMYCLFSALACSALQGSLSAPSWTLCQNETRKYRNETVMNIWCDFDRASLLICGNKMPTRCNRGFYCRFNLNFSVLQVPYSYTGCHRRKGPNFGRVFLMLNCTDITQNTYVQSWTVSEIMASEVWNFDSCYTLTDYQIHIETGRNMWFL